MKIKNVIDKEINAPKMSSRLLDQVEQIKQPSTKTKRRSVAWAVSLATSFAIIIGVIAIFFNNLGSGVSSINSYNVYLSINPAIMFTTDSNGVVTSQKALNQDGIKLLYNENFTSLNIADATNKVVNLCLEHGYLTSDKNIKVRVTDDKGNITKDKQDDFIKSLSFDNLIGLTDDEFDNIMDYTEEQIETWTEEVQRDFLNKLIELLDDKLNEMNSLIAKLKPFQDSELDSFIVDKDILGLIENFLNKYKGMIDELFDDDFNINNISFKLAGEIYEKLVDEVKDYNEIRAEINESNITDYEDLIEDLMEMAKDSIIQDD